MNRLMLLAPIALAACTNERPVTVLPPIELTTCADMPEAPSLPDRDGTTAIERARDEAVLGYILALRSAYGSCRGAVDGLATWREGMD